MTSPGQGQPGAPNTGSPTTGGPPIQRRWTGASAPAPHAPPATHSPPATYSPPVSAPPAVNSPYARPVQQSNGRDMSGVNDVLYGCLGAVIIGVWEMVKGIIGAIFS